MLERPDGKPKGTGFVTFTTKSAFQKALELNGSDHMGRTLKIEESQKGNQGKNNFAKNNKPQQNKSNFQNGNAQIETSTLFIGGLSYQSTAESIKEFFSAAGNVQSARVVTDKETGKVFFS